jgi:hypothetical protein
MDVVRLVLAETAAPQLPAGGVMRLARLLGLHSGTQQFAVQSLLARSAADAEEWRMATELCLGLVETGETWDSGV